MGDNKEHCVLCNQDVYLHPSMKLMNSVCGHKFCESCVTIRFMKTNSMVCPVCNFTLSRNALFSQAREDGMLEKENMIRKRVLRTYNKRQEDFPNLDSYNDYLEHVEDLIFNLVNGVNVETTNEELKRYAQDNSESININQAKRADEERAVVAKILEEQRQLEQRRNLRQIQDREESLQKEKKKEESKKTQSQQTQPNTQNTQNLQQQQSLQNPPNTQSQNPHPMQISQTTTTPPTQQNVPSYQPAQAQNVFRQPAPLSMPDMSAQVVSVSDRFTTKTQEDSAKAGGFSFDYIRQRSLEEAFQCLLFRNETYQP